jgi:hypothetical protein
MTTTAFVALAVIVAVPLFAAIGHGLHTLSRRRARGAPPIEALARRH